MKKVGGIISQTLAENVFMSKKWRITDIEGDEGPDDGWA